jgi:hypothetical protein
MVVGVSRRLLSRRSCGRPDPTVGWQPSARERPTCSPARTVLKQGQRHCVLPATKGAVLAIPGAALCLLGQSGVLRAVQPPVLLGDSDVGLVGADGRRSNVAHTVLPSRCAFTPQLGTVEDPHPRG